MLGKEGKCRQLIRTITGQTLLDQISNSVLRWTDVEDIEEHLGRHRLKWWGHLERMIVESLTRKFYQKTTVELIQGPKKTWEEM